jgi:hypothetical protein
MTRHRLVATAIASILAVFGFAQPASAVDMTLSGPSSINVSGSYSYYAHFSVPYVRFTWSVRSCPTATVEACSVAWSPATGAYYNPSVEVLARQLSYSCPGGKLVNTFQVKVIGTGFGQPAQTRYKVTDLCGEGPL